ncbi:hypothetical protein A2153_02565 [Candidatus Gottesmanbacteria bacterium RBG_16_38_7b]|uniref:SpoVT-AbrB domain-containing protein n=1 Tax=Candidatus Gottesmanbacteria bacterium RBG_16_38_7b TaxID=1798372 RepID=A0A1F5YLC2_9BACT|nr:MAG: hypothetical protein A2153_02565 [Candidatus Gottesmanbacteria bacterium RBG_16_38_7b]
MNTVDVIVKPMERGQITLPVKFRQKLGITKDTLLNVTLEGDRVVIIPLKQMMADFSSSVIKPEISKEKYLLLLKEFKGKLWSAQDDVERVRMKKSEKKWDW